MNRVYIEPTQLTDVLCGEESFGCRALDDYAQAYDNTWSKTDMPDDDVVFLKRVLATSEDEALWAMMNFCAEYERGLYVGNTFVDWPEPSLLLEAARAS